VTDHRAEHLKAMVQQCNCCTPKCYTEELIFLDSVTLDVAKMYTHEAGVERCRASLPRS
jgi:hypothetical protein